MTPCVGCSHGCIQRCPLASECRDEDIAPTHRPSPGTKSPFPTISAAALPSAGRRLFICASGAYAYGMKRAFAIAIVVVLAIGMVAMFFPAFMASTGH